MNKYQVKFNLPLWVLLGILTSCSDNPESPSANNPATEPASSDPAVKALPCTPSNQGICECSSEEGFTTYTLDVQDQQRCFTTYVPPSMANKNGPLVIANQCYAQNALGASGCRTGSPAWQAANEYGFTLVCASSTDGNWEFGNDGVANDANPTPCETKDSKDITYLQGIFSVVDDLAANGTVDLNRIFTEGFSQNSMFAAYTAICFPDRIAGIWQGGSGLYVKGITNPLPQMEGVCRRSDFLTYAQECETIAPCEECQYFPAYPIRRENPFKACVSAYLDDSLAETAEPMYQALSDEGYDATLVLFPNIGRGHSSPYNDWAWKVGCLEVVPHCSPNCAQAFIDCVQSRDSANEEEKLDAYTHCFARGRYTDLNGCAPNCAPTNSMLRTVESPCIVDGVCNADETASNCPLDCSD